VLTDLREKLSPFYSDIGRPSIDPELMLRMLIVGYCYGIRQASATTAPDHAICPQ
jgi:transposase